MSSLDELLRYEEEEPASHRVAPRPSSFRWLVRPVIIAVLGSVIGGLMMRAFGLAVPYPLIFMILLAAQLLRRTLAWVNPAPIPVTLLHQVRQPTGEHHSTPADGLYLATARWDTRLAWVRLQHDPEQFARTVQPRLVQLIDERLRLRHGVLRDREPERARELLGEPLWTFVSRPVRQGMSPRDVTALIGWMEKL
jgi:hypothetical protein